MGNKKEGIQGGVVRPAANAGTGPDDDKQAYNLSSLNNEKRKYILYVPESGPTDDQL